MSLHYILDGYNIIHKIAGLSIGSLEEQRRKLIRYVENNRPQGSDKNSVTIVFDGRLDVYGEHVASRVKIIFSKGQTADDQIKAMISDSSLKASTIVVTDDRDIQYSVGAVGAKAIGVGEFFAKEKTGHLSSTRQSKKAGKDNKIISKQIEFKINAEMEKIWLKDKP